jgi:hypothetical protein
LRKTQVVRVLVATYFSNKNAQASRDWLDVVTRLFVYGICSLLAPYNWLLAPGYLLEHEE